jgi:sugar (pentulose or hexulose) kinase
MNAEYLNFALTGRWGISHSMGTPFYLMDQASGTYNKPLLEKLGISEDMLPPIYDKGTVLGTLTLKAAERLGLSTDTKVVLGSFDHPSGAMGSGVFEEGEMLLSCGTSWVEFFPVASREFAISTKGLVDRFMLDGAPYCVMKSITSVSEKIDALRLHYLGKIPHSENDELLRGSKLGCNGLRFNFTEEDYTKAEGYSRSDVARAIIEGAALILKENLENLEKCGLSADRITMIGGISNSAECVRVASEVLGRPIRVANGQAAGAVGAALLGGIGAGIYKNEKDAFSVINN